MKKIVRRVGKTIRKLKKWSENFTKQGIIRSGYFRYREHSALRERWILLESQKGGAPSDNISMMLDELVSNPKYRSYRIFLSGEESVLAERKNYITAKGLSARVELLTIDTPRYYKVLAAAKYLVNDESFIYFFTKRSGQVYLNLWHGTPLMTLGKSKKFDHAVIGNEQKNFFDADYLLCPNEFTRDCFLEDYMLSNFAKGTLWMSGYPRNEILLNANLYETVRSSHGLEEKQVIAYLPTWRNNTKEQSKQVRTENLKALLQQWDASLSEQQVVYMNQHPINKLPVDFSEYRHIRPFPAGCSIYEFLMAADMLVTDYSSVMFDYLLTGRKIILFTHDREYYETVRGLHMELSRLPFPKVDTVQDLMKELALPKNYDDAGFKSRFCPYDKEGVTGALCRKLIFEEDSPLIEERDIPYNGKKNVLLYVGTFGKNGLTTSAVNLLNTLDLSKHNYAVVYYMGDMKSHPEFIRVVPEQVARYGIYFYRCVTFFEKVRYMLWREFDKVPYRLTKGAIEKMSKRESERLFGGLRLDTVIQFAGYDDEMTGAMEKTDCNRIIYVHSDMEQEILVRKNSDRNFLKKMYNSYDSVAVVTEGVMAPARRIADSDTANFVLCHNVIDYKNILRRGEEPLLFDEDTVCFPSEEALREVLREVLVSKKKIFVTVGRFSAEKGHKRLIQAFERLHRECPDTGLIIVGGHGNLWETTLKQVKNSSCPEDIFLVRFMSNPYPLMKQCDYFVLPSLYEGFGLVLAEADILGVPCFTVDIPGPRGFMEKHGGLLVENSEDGILKGMQACMEENVPKRLQIEYGQYNLAAVKQFESML